MVQYSILFADGDPNITQYFTGILKANGFDAVGATSGLEALGLYKSMSPDLVVTDLALSEMGGMTLFEEILKYDPSARVIITPDDANKDVVTRAFRMGALDVIEKPLDINALISLIRRGSSTDCKQSVAPATSHPAEAVAGEAPHVVGLAVGVAVQDQAGLGDLVLVEAGVVVGLGR